MVPEKLRAILDAGPPKEPDMIGNPGPMLRALDEILRAEECGQGRTRSANAALLLAHLIDLRDWKSESEAYAKLGKALEAAKAVAELLGALKTQGVIP